VNTSVRVGPFHYFVHVSLVLFAFLMWMPVCGPVPELRLTLPVQMGYIFLMSVIPTIPSAFLIVAENPIYRAYDGPFRMWGISVIQDQQAAGLIMKLGGGFYLWTIITVLFFKWSARHLEAERQSRVVTERDVLTFELVQAEFDRAGQPPADVKPEAAS
jgi:putative membrane protein